MKDKTEDINWPAIQAGSILAIPDETPDEVPYITLSNNDEEIIGKLIKQNGQLHFEGDADESALIFLDAFITPNNATLKKYKEALEKISKIDTDYEHGQEHELEYGPKWAKEALKPD